MTPAELQSEWRYVYHERIGMLVGSGEPSEQHKAMARKDADESIQQLSQQPDARET